ncbi:MAG: cupin domain-containing protein [Rhizobiaceae bacterium]|nr:cupin domain-containing protein [Rhizobiaceae bacterium]
MELNADFSERAVVHAGKQEWVPSPMKGVDRRMLDRIGGEVARATTIVRYAPGSHFSAHTHTGGEEFLVLDGVFQDEHGDFPAGTYVRNPPTSEHTPGSEPGCTIFVKLWQFDMEDRHQMSVDTNTAQWSLDPGREGVNILPLYSDDREDVSMEVWDAGQKVGLDSPNGLEVLVVEGSFTESGETFEKQSWLRLPTKASSIAEAGTNGCKVWIKRNHLKETPQAPSA